MLVRREPEGPFNKAPVVRAVSAFLLVVAVLATLTRVVTKLILVRRCKTDDNLIIAAAVISVVQSIVVILQGANGLGKPKNTLADGHVNSILQGQYAADVLYVTVLLLAKLSATRTMMGLGPRSKRSTTMVIEGIICLWGVSSIVALLFQCNLPAPWDYINGICINRFGFWLYIDIFNAVTDLAIAFVVYQVFKGLQISTSKKAMVMGVFGCRIFVIPSIICHIIYYNRAVNSTDATFDMWAPIIIRQVTQCMGILVTCLPSLKPLLDSLESGQWVVGDIRQTRSKGSSSRSKSGTAGGARVVASGASRSTNNRQGSSKLHSIAALASNGSHRRQNYEMIDMGRSADKSAKGGETTSGAAAEDPNRWWDGESHTSQTVLVQQSWTVEFERASAKKANRSG